MTEVVSCFYCSVQVRVVAAKRDLSICPKCKTSLKLDRKGIRLAFLKECYDQHFQPNATNQFIYFIRDIDIEYEKAIEYLKGKNLLKGNKSTTWDKTISKYVLTITEKGIDTYESGAKYISLETVLLPSKLSKKNEKQVTELRTKETSFEYGIKKECERRRKLGKLKPFLYDHRYTFSTYRQMAIVDPTKESIIHNLSGYFIDQKDFDEYGWLKVTLNKKVTFLNEEGQYIKTGWFSQATPFKHGVALVKVNNKWGMIDRNGDWIIPTEYEIESARFVDGYMVIKKNEKWGTLSEKGRIVLEPQLSKKAYIYSGTIHLTVNDRKYTIFCNKDNSKVKEEINHSLKMSESALYRFLNKKWKFY